MHEERLRKLETLEQEGKFGKDNPQRTGLEAEPRFWKPLTPTLYKEVKRFCLKVRLAVLLAIIAICLISYFVYSAYWLAKTLPWIWNIAVNPGGFSPPTGLIVRNSNSLSSAYLMEYTGFVGLIMRLVGASVALVAFVYIVKDGVHSFPRHKGKLSAALLINGLFFLTLVPVIYFLLNYSALPTISNRLLSLNQVTEIALMSSFLIYIGLKVRKSDVTVDSAFLWRLVGLAATAYVVAIWIIYMSKWTEMMAVDPYLFSALSARIIGFMNTIIVQTLAVALAVAAAIAMSLKKLSSKTPLLWGLALVLLSLHTVIYTIYCAFVVGIPRFIIFGELWQIPLMALGVYLCVSVFKSGKQTETTA